MSGALDLEVTVNRIQRIAAAAAVSTAVLAPATAAVAFAKPYPWHKSDSASGVTKPKAQIDYEERLQQEQSGPGSELPSGTSGDATGFPWDTVGLAALGAGVIATGGAIVVRRSHRVPTHA